MTRPLYQLLLLLILPWLLVDAWRRWRRAPAGTPLWSQFGRLPPDLPVGGIWLHAVSLGEVRAAASLIRALHLRWPDRPLCLSTTTETGAEAARALDVPHFYAPYDYGWVIRRVLRRLRPQLIVVLETELWPNWIRAASEQDVPLAVVNARLSDRSYRAYRRLGGRLLQQTLADLPLICAQSPADQARFRQLMTDPVTPARIRECGNIKFDLDPPDCRPWVVPRGRPVWLAASTHEGEEALVLDAHRQLRDRYPGALLVLAPRHPERVTAVSALIRQAGLSVECLTEAERPATDTAVWLVDRTGVLMPYFAAIPTILLGGSLVPVGGHNPIEPAVYGHAVIVGPHTRNFQAVFARLREADAVQELPAAGAASLAAAVDQAWQDPAAQQELGRRAERIVAANRGATQRIIEALDELL